MFSHIFKYEFLQGIRQKEVTFWMVLFPIILGTFFHVAFADIYDKTTKFNTVPVAIVETKENATFDTVMEEMGKGENPLFKVEYTTKEKALEKLKAEDVNGIIFVDDDLSLSVSGNGIEQTIIKSFLETYKVQEKVITQTAMENPQKLDAVISKLNSDVSSNENIPLTDGNPDNLLQYFYNLIAMVALLGSMTGLSVAISNQGNLSALGARKCCSPTNKMVTIVSSLFASFAVQIICTFVTISYLAFVLKVDFADKLLLVYISGFVASILGVAMGFFIGSIGKMSENTKGAISMAVSLSSCFLSGLMIANMKAVCAAYVPWFNEINPATVISDTFYCLNVYNDYTRFTEKIIVMLIMTAVFMAGGFILTRRRKYASL